MGLTERSFLERMELMGFTPSRATTNADRIRSMADEELAKWIAHNTSCETCVVRKTSENPVCQFSDCAFSWKLWLKSPVEVDE